MQSVSVQTLTRLFSRLWPHITSRRRWQFGVLLILMLLASIAEIVGIGLVLPFLGVLTAPVRVFEHPVAKPYIQALNFHSADELLLPLTIK